MPTDDEPQPPGFRTPGVFINRYDVRFTNVARIIFQDALVGKHGAERTHVVMTIPDALALANLIQSVAREHMEKSG